MQPVLFYSRCKPNMLDVREVAIKHRCVFFGYPLRRDGVTYNKLDPLSHLVSPDAAEEVWATHFRRGAPDSRQHSMNRNFVQRVGENSIAMVPMPHQGVVCAGRIKGAFRMSHNEARNKDALTEFKRLGAEVKNDSDSHAAELAQGWDVDAWVRLPLPVIPGWIRASLFGRSTYGVIDSDGAPANARDIIAKLMVLSVEGKSFEPRDWSLDTQIARTRLLETLTPNLFEGLMVSVLQLEYPDLCWLGVGGSGDGGVDGIAYNDKGEVEVVLQCKWKWDGKPAFREPLVWSGEQKPLQRYFAHMSSTPGAHGSDVRVFGPDSIVDLVIKHSAGLPFAKSLRLGSGK